MFISEAANHQWDVLRNNHDKSKFAVYFSPSDTSSNALDERFACQFLLLGIHSSGEICAADPEPQPPDLFGKMSFTKTVFYKKPCSMPLWLAVHLSSLHSYHQRPASSQQKVLLLRESLAAANHYIKRICLPRPALRAKCSALSLTPA